MRGPVRVRGELLVATAAALWALIGVFARELDTLGMPAEQVGAWRALIGGTCFVLHASIRAAAARSTAAGESRPRIAGWPRMSRRDHLDLVLFCLVGVVVFYASLPLAVDTGGLSLAWVLLYTAPIWVTLGAALFLGERPGARQAGAVALAVAGVVALVASVGGTVEVTWWSISWGLAAGISYSSYYLRGRRLFGHMGAIRVYALVLPVGGVILAFITRISVPATSMVVWLVLLGVASTYVPYLLFGIGVQAMSSSRAVVVATIEPVVAIVLGVMLYGETLGVLGVFGAVLVLVAAATAALARTTSVD